jgi:hypothetical protein
MAVGDVYEVNLEYGVHQRAMTVNLWFEVTTDPATVERTAQDLVSAVDAAGLVGQLASLQSVQAIWDRITAYKRFDSAGVLSQGPPGFLHQAQAGAVGFEGIPDSLPIVIEWAQVAQSARANGRCFLSGISEDSVEGNRLKQTFIDGAVAAFIAAWEATLTNIAGSDGGTYRQIVVSKLLALAPYLNAKYGTPIDVTSVMVNPLLKNQKRRQSRWESGSRT